MPNRKDIEFTTTDGLKLRGWLYSAGEKRPTIILSNGVSRAAFVAERQPRVRPTDNKLLVLRRERRLLR
jgi:hypothetical protein